MKAALDSGETHFFRWWKKWGSGGALTCEGWLWDVTLWNWSPPICYPDVYRRWLQSGFLSVSQQRTDFQTLSYCFSIGSFPLQWTAGCFPSSSKWNIAYLNGWNGWKSVMWEPTSHLKSPWVLQSPNQWKIFKNLAKVSGIPGLLPSFSRCSDFQ